MIWIMLATLAVVFVVGFRVLTSGARKAIRRLSDRLNIDVVPVESMVDQMGKSAGDEFLRYLHRPDESHLQNAAQVLLIWQIVIVDGSEQNLLQWHRILQKARLAAPITDAQVRLIFGCSPDWLKFGENVPYPKSSKGRINWNRGGEKDIDALLEPDNKGRKVSSIHIFRVNESGNILILREFENSIL